MARATRLEAAVVVLGYAALLGAAGYGWQSGWIRVGAPPAPAPRVRPPLAPLAQLIPALTTPDPTVPGPLLATAGFERPPAWTTDPAAQKAIFEEMWPRLSALGDQLDALGLSASFSRPWRVLSVEFPATVDLVALDRALAARWGGPGTAVGHDCYWAGGPAGVQVGRVIDLEDGEVSLQWTHFITPEAWVGSVGTDQLGVAPRPVMGLDVAAYYRMVNEAVDVRDPDLAEAYTLAGSWAWPGAGLGSTTTTLSAQFSKGRVTRWEVWLATPVVPRLLELLRGKYGAPVRDETDEDDQVVAWLRPGLRIEAEVTRAPGELDELDLTFSVPDDDDDDDGAEEEEP